MWVCLFSDWIQLRLVLGVRFYWRAIKFTEVMVISLQSQLIGRPKAGGLQVLVLRRHKMSFRSHLFGYCSSTGWSPVVITEAIRMQI